MYHSDRHFSTALKVIFAGFLVFFSQAKADTGSLTETIIEYLQSPTGQSLILDSLDIPPDRRDIYTQHIRELYSDEVLLREMVENLLSATDDLTLGDSDQVAIIIAEVGFGVVQQAISSGLNRLHPNETRILITHDVLLTESLPPNLCVAVLDGNITAEEHRSLGAWYQDQLTRGELRQYLFLSRKAITSYFHDSPAPKTISPAQEQIALDMLSRRVSQHPHAELLEPILTSPSSFSEAENCWANTEVIWLAIDEPGVVGDWLIIWMANELH